jgi:carboxypeptidase Q
MRQGHPILELYVMRRGLFLYASLLLVFLACPLPARPQLPPVKNPLAPTQNPSASAACSATDASSCVEVTVKLLPLILGPSPMEENLRRLTDEIGGRVTGTPEMAKAVEWAVAAFRAANIDVHTEKYTLPVTWSEGKTELLVNQPFRRLRSENGAGKISAVADMRSLRAVSVAWSPATPSDVIQARIVDVGYGSEDDFVKARPTLNGAVLLVHTDVSSTWADLSNEYSRPPAIIDRAVKGGAAAILWMSARERLLMYRHTNSLAGEIDKIPQAIVAREDAMWLARLVAVYPDGIQAYLSTPNKSGGPIEQQNVIGEIRGYEKPDEAVILGAHLDSWDLGTGALDNGCNAALVIEAARALKATGLLPRRTIRFVLFSGEEQGLIGSHEYVKAHRAELDKIRAMIVFDNGIGRVTGYSLGGRHDMEVGVRAVLQSLDSWNVNNHTFDASAGDTDNFDFLLEGVPTLYANQEEANYLPNYHAASDTFDKVDIRELKLNTVIAALTAWGVADRTEPLGKRLTRGEMETLMKETGLDQQMKTLGMWNDWQSGARGRQP